MLYNDGTLCKFKIIPVNFLHDTILTKGTARPRITQ